MKKQLTADQKLEAKIAKRERELRKEIRALLMDLKKDIGDDYRASEDPEDNTPGMQVTFATDDLTSWNYQTGDNSYTGGCYGLKHWGVISLYRRSNCADLAKEAVDEMTDSAWEDIQANAKAYTYHINLDERGSFYADVRDPEGETVYEVKGGNELSEDESSLVDDGYMKNLRDVDGLNSYLQEMDVIPQGSTLAEEN